MAIKETSNETRPAKYNIVVYRANDILSQRLQGVKEEADYFHEFSQGTNSQEIRSWFQEELFPSLDQKVVDPVLFADETCFFSVGKESLFEHVSPLSVKLIQQDEGSFKTYVTAMAEQLREKEEYVTIVEKCIGHHAIIDGMDPCEVREGKDTWYANMVLQKWEEALKERNISYSVVPSLPPDEDLFGRTIICDHHTGIWGVQRRVEERGEFVNVVSPYQNAVDELTLEELLKRFSIDK